MPLESCSTVIFPLERLNFSPGCPQKRSHQKRGPIEHLGMPILLSSPRQLLMLVFQCENPSTLSGVTMIESALALFHEVITFLIFQTREYKLLQIIFQAVMNYSLFTAYLHRIGLYEDYKENIFKYYVHFLLLSKDTRNLIHIVLLFQKLLSLKAMSLCVIGKAGSNSFPTLWKKKQGQLTKEQFADHITAVLLELMIFSPRGIPTPASSVVCNSCSSNEAPSQNILIRLCTVT